MPSKLMSAPEDVYRQFGRILAKRRSEAQLSQSELADALGLSRTSVTNIENGRQAVNLYTLLCIAAILGREIADLLPPGLTAHQTRSANAQHLTSKELDWVNSVIAAKREKLK